jgi:S-formylglutathione hydrolase FrmB
MTTKAAICLLAIFLTAGSPKCQEYKTQKAPIDYVSAFKDTLINMGNRSDNLYFKMHCNSIVTVIDRKINSSAVDTAFLVSAYNAFNKQDAASPKLLSTYLNRKRPFIFSWISPTDGAVSFAWMNPPKNWNPENKYPVYIQLHGLWSVAANSIEYLTYPYLQAASANTSFEDGYLLSPWGRGNYWYQGISETDIFECLKAFEKTVTIDSTRRYLSGHSMGGYGAWSIASKSSHIWAALGIYAGALWYYPNVLNNEVVRQLDDIPTYFVCGLNDNLLGVNQQAYQLLQGAGNKDMIFITFSGGHEYTEQNVNNMYLWMRNRIKKYQSTSVIPDKQTGDISFKSIYFPDKNHLMLKLNSNINSKGDIRIFDPNGRLILSRNNIRIRPEENSFDFDVSGLCQGFYIVQLKTGQKSVSAKMILE